MVKNFTATDKKNNRIRRVYFVLLGATLLTVLSAVLKGANQTTCALAFYAFYYGFILLALYLSSPKSVDETETQEGEVACNCCKCCKVLKICLIVAFAFSGICFFVTMPALFGFKTVSVWTKIISWLTIL